MGRAPRPRKSLLETIAVVSLIVLLMHKSQWRRVLKLNRIAFKIRRQLSIRLRLYDDLLDTWSLYILKTNVEQRAKCTTLLLLYEMTSIAIKYSVVRSDLINVYRPSVQLSRLVDTNLVLRHRKRFSSTRWPSYPHSGVRTSRSYHIRR